MQKVRFLKSEVASFLEEKVLDNIATQEELELYEGLRWNGKLEMNYIYKKLVRQMRKIYHNGF